MNTRRRPKLAMDHPERFAMWRLFYEGDDEYDLVELVRDRYQADITAFGYTFPSANASREAARVPAVAT